MVRSLESFLAEYSVLEVELRLRKVIFLAREMRIRKSLGFKMSVFMILLLLTCESASLDIRQCQA